MLAISSFSAELTSRCLFNEVFPANSEETIRAENAWPQPPVCVMCQRDKISGSERARGPDEPDMSVIST